MSNDETALYEAILRIENVEELELCRNILYEVQLIGLYKKIYDPNRECS